MTSAAAQPAPVPVPGPTIEYLLDPAHTSVTFRVRHMMITNVRGEFQKVSGQISLDPSRPTSARVRASIDVSSIQTRESQRDAHLKSADFFDAARYPTIEFSSKSVRALDAGKLEVEGALTLRGTTRTIVLQVEGPTVEHLDPWGKRRIGASASAQIRRSDFGMTWNNVIEAGGFLVGDEVTIDIDASFVRKE